MPKPTFRLALTLLTSVVLAVAPTAAARPAQSTFNAVAAENFWGSIASQLAGDRATVESIIVNPDTDPHTYEPTPSDARTMAGSQLAIVNGIGYDNWASQLLAADPSGSRIVLNVGDLLGLKDGDNPHQWYSPASVAKVIGAIVADYGRLDPAGKAYFAARRHYVETTAFARYNQLRAEIRRRFSGVPVGYSESIFQPLGESLGLRLLTPSSFTKAVAEGTEITANDKQTVDRQAEHRLTKVWVLNSQNVTPEVQEVSSIAKAKGIPIATVTETLSPASLTFEQWQVAELGGLIKALHQATGR